MADLNILIVGKLDEAKSVTEINKQLDYLQSKLKSLSLDVKFDEKIISSMNKFSESMSKFIDVAKIYDTELRDIVNAQKQADAQNQKSAKTIDDLESEYGDLGKTIKEVTRLNKELEESGRTTVFEPNKGERFSVNTDKDGGITSVSIANTQANLGNLIGTYAQLQQAEISELDLSKALSYAYQDREIRAVSLDSVTGKWSATLSENAKQNRVLKGVIDQTTGGLFKQSDALQQVKNVNMGFLEQLKVAITRIPVWMLGMQMFYSSVHFFTDSIKYLGELDAKLNEIAIVTNKSQIEVSKLAKEYNDLAYSMATTTQGVAEASVTFYRQGLAQADVLDRTKTSLMYAKVANESFTQSSETLTAVVNSMGVSIETAADNLTYLGDATASESKEIRNVTFWN
jgi:hypothetical protein